jgi:hypothetical protein
MAMVDVKRLAAEVSLQHGIRLDPDDPIMAVVTLNQLVFEQSVGVVVDRVASSVRELEQAADKVQARAGIVLAQEVRDCVVSLRQELGKDMDSVSIRPHLNSRGWDERLSFFGIRTWVTVGLVLAAVLFSAGVWLGACLR